MTHQLSGKSTDGGLMPTRIHRKSTLCFNQIKMSGKLSIILASSRSILTRI
jgi:hypothetical protein